MRPFVIKKTYFYHYLLQRIFSAPIYFRIHQPQHILYVKAKKKALQHNRHCKRNVPEAKPYIYKKQDRNTAALPE